MSQNETLTLTKEELQVMLKQAASAALKELGLHDEEAPRDIRELRDLISAYRFARSTVARTIIQSVTAAVLGAMALGTYLKLSGKS